MWMLYSLEAKTMRLRVGLLIGVFAVFLLSNSCGDPGYKVWIADSLEKVFQDDVGPGQPLESHTVLLARNGHGSLQVAVRPNRVLTDFSLDVELQSSESVKPIATVRTVGYVPVAKNTPESPEDEIIRKAPAEFPDPLYNTIPTELSPGFTHVFWVTLFAPSETQPGTFQGKVRISLGEEEVATTSFIVEVANAVVPKQQHLKVTNWFSTGRGHLGRVYGFDEDEDAYWTILGNIAKVMAAHRQNVILTPVTDLVKVSFSGKAYSFDFSDFDRWVQIFSDAGLIGTIEGGHLLSRPTGYFSPVIVPAWVPVGNQIELQQLEPDDPRATAFISSFLDALYQHLKEEGLLDSYVQHLHDEPHDEEIPIYEKYAELVRKHLPGVPLVDAVDLEQNTGFLDRYLDTWVPVLSSFDDRLEVLEEHRKRGGTTWYYTCVNPQGRYLNRFIDYSLLKVRLLHWFNFRHHLEGYLHWGGNYWAEDPFKNVEPVINDGRTLLPPGDNAIVYPDIENRSVFSSIRLEAMLEGIEDYELLVALEQHDPDEASELVRKAVPGINDYIRDTGEFRRLERGLLEASSEAGR